MSKPILFSAIKATGKMHIGNYLGAVKNWVELQNSGEYEAIYSVADLHTITIDIEPEVLRENTFEMVVDILAAGVDPEKSIIFVQSHVSQHAELAWIFNCVTPVAELERMTQFKDKAKVHKQNVNMGLFDYPALMAADILLYHGTVVPVGDDQDQHVELARIVARKFNNRWGQYFEEPKTVLTKVTRLMALNDPTKKMSKETGPKSYIAMNDTRDEIEKKIKSAVSGEEGGVNLVGLLESFCDDEEKVEIYKKQVEDGTVQFAELKNDLIEAVSSHLEAFQKRRQEIAGDREYVEKVIAEGAERAKKIASKNFEEIKEKVGLI